MSEVKIPEGYKQTEFGISPIIWKQCKLEEIADVIDPHPSHRAPPEVKNGIPFLGIGDLDEHGRIIKDSYRTVGHYIFNEHSIRYNLNDGLIGLGRVASIGKVVKFDKLSIKFTISPTLGLIRPKSVHFDYLAHFLKSDFVLNQFRQIMSGSTRSSVGMQVLRKLIVLVPSPEEQTAIATALSDVDDLIKSLETLITKKEAIKTATMQQLLTGKTRLPEFATREDGSAKGFKQTELELIPEDWGFDKLDSLSEVIDPHPSHRAPAEFANGIPFLGIGDINERGEIIKSNFRKVGSYVLEEHASRYRLGEGLIGLGRVASIGKVIIFNNALKDCTISPTLGLIRPRNINLDYLGFFLKSEFITNQFRQVMSGSTRSSVGMIVLRKLIILTPSKLEQTAIATILSDMDSEIQALQKRLEKTRDIKQGMMQQLLTGKVRLVSSTNKGV